MEGADFVLHSIRVGGMAARARDERIAIENGLAGQETTGPAGAAMALRTLPVARLQLTTHLDNPASQRVAEKAGYVREAVLRSWTEQRGTRVDLIMYSLLASDLA